MNEVFLTKSSFAKMVEKYARDKQTSYMDAVVDLCEELNIDPEDIGRYISNVIKEKIEGEAMKLNLLPRQNMLEFE
jgi:hypothetical protein